MLLRDFQIDFLKILSAEHDPKKIRSLRSKYLENWFKNPPKMLLRDFQIDFLKILRPQGRPRRIGRFAQNISKIGSKIIQNHN
jgi:hypothetical protein